MMVKNEEDNLPRCLESLKPLLDCGLSEIIIVDTGSSDRTVEIAKQYTDNIYHHKWNDNFSDMRNKSISYAKCEWILIIDADEELSNPDEMIRLFQQNITKYYTIAIDMRSFLNKQREGSKKTSVDSVLNRGFRNTKDFRFDGAIHEQPLYRTPILKSEIRFYHYGYVFEDLELKKYKFKRNVNILEKELKKNPDNIYYQYQIAVSYYNEDINQALIEIEKAYKLFNKLDIKEKSNYPYIFGVYGRILYQLNEYKKLIKICDEALSYREDNIDILYFLGLAYAFYNENNKAMECLKKYIKSMDDLDNNVLYKSTTVDFYHVDEDSVQMVLQKIGYIYLYEDKIDMAIGFADKMKNSKYKNALVVRIYIENKDIEYLENYLRGIICEDGLKQNLFDILEKQRQNKNEIIRICNAVINIFESKNELENKSIDDPYYLLCKVRLSLVENREIEKQYIDKIIQVDYTSLPYYYGEIIYYLMLKKISISNLQHRIPSGVFVPFIEHSVTKYKEYSRQFIDNVMTLSMQADNIGIMYLIDALRVILLRCELDDKKYKELFDIYFANGITYLNNIYNISIINNKRYDLIKDDEHIFFMYLYEASEVINENLKQYVKCLRNALKVFPMHRGIEILMKAVEEDVNTIMTKNNAYNEMEELKKSFKVSIRNMITANQIDEAIEMIKSYEELVKDDEEMNLIKMQILSVNNMVNDVIH